MFMCFLENSGKMLTMSKQYTSILRSCDDLDGHYSVQQMKLKGLAQYQQ